MNIRRRPIGPDRTTAWMVGEGDVLPGGAEVLAVRREAVTGRVRICTTTRPTGVELDRDDPVDITRRAT